MNAKLFSCLFLAIFAFQATTDATHHRVKIAPRKSQKDLIDDALAAIEELKAIVRGAIDDAKASIAGYLLDAQNLGDATIASGSIQLQGEADKVLAEIAVLRQQAADLGQTIEGCIGTQEDEIKQLPLTLATELIHCITDQINEAVIIISDIVATIETTWDTVTSLDEDLTACDGDWICLGEVIAECAFKVVDLPIEIAIEVVRVEDFIATIKTDLEACAVAKVTQIALEAGAILVNVAECVAAQLGK